MLLKVTRTVNEICELHRMLRTTKIYSVCKHAQRLHKLSMQAACGATVCPPQLYTVLEMATGFLVHITSKQDFKNLCLTKVEDI